MGVGNSGGVGFFTFNSLEDKLALEFCAHIDRLLDKRPEVADPEIRSKVILGVKNKMVEQWNAENNGKMARAFEKAIRRCHPELESPRPASASP